MAPKLAAPAFGPHSAFDRTPPSEVDLRGFQLPVRPFLTSARGGSRRATRLSRARGVQGIVLRVWAPYRLGVLKVGSISRDRRQLPPVPIRALTIVTASFHPP